MALNVCCAATRHDVSGTATAALTSTATETAIDHVERPHLHTGGRRISVERFGHFWDGIEIASHC
jgi:hypothetical protein